jgi:hypothetical protein
VEVCLIEQVKKSIDVAEECYSVRSVKHRHNALAGTVTRVGKDKAMTAMRQNIDSVDCRLAVMCHTLGKKSR